jgi:hypothetical protein
MGVWMSFSEPDTSTVVPMQNEQRMSHKNDVLPLTDIEGQMQMSSALENLPDETVRDICEFLRKEPPLHFDAYGVGERAPNQTDIRAMLSTCTRLRELKLAETGLWPFNRVYSKIYCTEEAFRAEVDGAFAAMGFGFDEDGNPQKQLPIVMRLAKDSSVIDVSALGNVHTLYLNGCTGIRDVSALGNVHDLYLNGCSGIRDVSALGNVHTLYLWRCTGITDVSALGSVHTLNLQYCTGIRDVSALGNVHTLNLDGCTGITKRW